MKNKQGPYATNDNHLVDMGTFWKPVGKVGQLYGVRFIKTR